MEAKDTVEFQLIERTLMHYLCFSDDALINDALLNAKITDDKEKQAYKAQIKQNNEAHVIAALNQKKKNNEYVISSDTLTGLAVRDEIKGLITQANQARLHGGKPKTKKVRKIRRQIGGDINPTNLNAIHA